MLTLEDSIVLGNSADSLGSGGGLYNTFNEATLGGGIYSAGRLVVQNSTILNNLASGVFPNVGRGGGIHNFSDGPDGALPGLLTMFNSTGGRAARRRSTVRCHL